MGGGEKGAGRGEEVERCRAFSRPHANTKKGASRFRSRPLLAISPNGTVRRFRELICVHMFLSLIFRKTPRAFRATKIFSFCRVRVLALTEASRQSRRGRNSQARATRVHAGEQASGRVFDRTARSARSLPDQRTTAAAFSPAENRSVPDISRRTREGSRAVIDMADYAGSSMAALAARHAQLGVRVLSSHARLPSRGDSPRRVLARVPRARARFAILFPPSGNALARAFPAGTPARRSPLVSSSPSGLACPSPRDIHHRSPPSSRRT